MTQRVEILGAVLLTVLLAPALALPTAAQDQNKGWEAQVKPASEPASPASGDPLEGLNRVTSSFNRILRQWVIDPVVDGYQAITPDEVQRAVSNVASNLTEPLTVGASLLQGDTENAAVATKRFFINTTVGLGGINDVATEQGYEQRREDLGQAMGAHGVGPGPHIVLPIIGPSNFRDAAGDIATFFINPLPTAATVGTAGVGYSDKQDAVKAVGQNAVDPYVAERDSYRQNRQFVINNGQQVEVPIIADIR